MGIFDSVYVACPNCREQVEFQSKAAEEPYLNRYTTENAPDEILWDIINAPEYCGKCGSWLALVDPRYPPGKRPRPHLSAVLVVTPENPKTHSDNIRWWPETKPFTYDDILPRPPVEPEDRAAAIADIMAMSFGPPEAPTGRETSGEETLE